MERLSRDLLKDKEEWSHSNKGTKTDQGTMIEQGMSGVEKTRSGEAPACNKEGSYVHTMGVVHSMRYLVLESILF